MISLLGHLAVFSALLLALAGCLASFAGGALERPLLIRWGRRGAFGVCGLVTAAAGLMIYALVTHDFSVKYVFDVGSRDMPLYYTVISLWGALEGSILFWALLLALYTTAFLLNYRRRFVELQPYVAGILLAISSFFLFVIAFPGDPFVRLDPVPADGQGLVPLLQNHPMMGLHPPLLYLGYVGLSVPFAIAMASLLARGAGPEALRLVRRWALIPWVCLSLGIVAGMWWSYAVLGWGGYWSWDPVENASVMPWLVTTAFLHSLQVQERRQMLKTWTMSLIIIAFLLSIFGTFLTRSGVLKSVHTFTTSSIGPLFLGFLAVAMVLSLGLLFARSEELATPGALDAVVCRETAFLFNNLLLVALTFTILLGTIFPLIASALQGTDLSVGAPYFNQVTVPIGFALLFLMGVGPLLPWGAGRLEGVQYRLLPPVAIGVVAVLLLLLIGVRGVGALVTFGVSAFVLAVTVGRVLADVRKRHGNTRDGWGASAGRLFTANPRRYGGYLAHLGVVLLVIGIAASQSYGARATATLRPGQTTSVDGYTVTYRGFDPRLESNRMVFEARLTARRGAEDLGTLRPSLNTYFTSAQGPVPSPAVREEPLGMVTGLLNGQNPLPDVAQLFQGRNPFEDLYIVLQAFDGTNANHHNANRRIVIQVLVNPMVGLIWLGGFLVGMGGVIALVPARRRRRVSVLVPEPVRLQAEEATV